MLVASERTVALRCPLCGRFGVHRFTLFDFSRRREYRVNCECGFCKMVISAPNGKEYALEIPCIVCETGHVLRLHRSEFWNSALHSLCCPEDRIPLGYLGQSDAVTATISGLTQNSSSIVNDEGFDDYFRSPEIMYQVLTRLNELSDDGRICCSCGRKEIEVDVSPGSLELHCPSCNSTQTIRAETVADLEMLQLTEAIRLSKRGTSDSTSSGLRVVSRRKRLDKSK